MQIEHKKNTLYYLAFPMVDSLAPESFKTGETVSDEAYYKDGAGAWTSLAITDTVAEIGSTGLYEVNLTAAELNHDQVIIKMTSTNSADTAFLFNLNTLAVDDLATAVDLATVDGIVDTILVDTADLQANQGSWVTATGFATAAALATAQTDLDTITGSDGVTLATAQALYAPNKVVPDAAGVAPTATEVADALLNRDMSLVTDTNARTPLNAFRFLRNKYSVTGSTLTVTKEDDSTSAWTSTLTSSASADPVTGSDPA
jgi:hypothetical protein